MKHNNYEKKITQFYKRVYTVSFSSLIIFIDTYNQNIGWVIGNTILSFSF